MTSCCGPSRPVGSSVAVHPADGERPAGPPLVDLAGGAFAMGSAERAYPADGEGPVRSVQVRTFRLSARAVSNDDFSAFVEATGYLTTAERETWSFVFASLLPDDFPATRAVVQAPWWRQVFGATWRRPEGPGSDLDGRADHPVVHVSWLDAREYCRWSGTRLPSETEWEFAARGGLHQRRFPWGDELTPGGEHRMNVFQGPFPQPSGAVGTEPVGFFAPNDFGLFNMTGNVWEWCSDRFGTSRPGQRTMRGGSYLCHESYCWRYRCAARSANTPDSSAGNIGFRVAADAMS